jgi:hypothetical protein
VASATSEGDSPDASALLFRDTPLFVRSPYFREVLAVFQCPLKAVRLLSLAPGSFIREHSDNALDFEDGEIRIHVPIETNPGVEFCVSGERLLFEEGGCYYVNVNLPHRVANRGKSDRIHLVIDAQVNDWVRDLFRRCMEERRCIPLGTPESQSCDDFRRRLFFDAALRERAYQALEPVEAVDEFCGGAAKLGREYGYDFDEIDAAVAMRQALPFREAAATATPDLSDWIPVKVYARNGRPFAEWIARSGCDFKFPFFSQSVLAALRRPLCRFSRCELPLDRMQSAAPITPSGLIFHVSRCGSALVSQMLATLPGAAVLAEPAPLDETIQLSLDGALDFDQRLEWLRWIATALGDAQAAASGRYFLKLDAWHIHEFRLLRAAFPETPWIFLHRQIEDVVASQMRIPGIHAMPGAIDPRILRMSIDDIVKYDRRTWCERVITDFIDAAEAFRSDAKGLFVDYAELPRAVWERIAPHFGLSPTTEDIARMQEAARYDSKMPGKLFEKAG